MGGIPLLPLPTSAKLAEHVRRALVVYAIKVLEQSDEPEPAGWGSFLELVELAAQRGPVDPATLPLDQAARHAGLSPRQLRRLRDRGDVDTVLVRGRKHVPVADLEALNRS